MDLSIEGLLIYMAIGSSNVQKLDDSRTMFTGVTPSHAAKLLNVGVRPLRAWLVKLAAKGLLIRDRYGAYKVSDMDTWFEVSKLICRT